MEIPKTKRILWLLNHTTLRDSEVPMLQRLGFEVYVPKVIPFDEANPSTSVTYDYDPSLSIPQDFLNTLNKFDFNTRKWPGSLARGINKYFGAAIVPFFPKMVDGVNNSFEGALFLRVFGLEGDVTYALRLETYFSAKVVSRLRKGQGIWVTAGFGNTIDHEPLWIRRKAIHLPLGLPAPIYTHADQWHGSEKRILFVCPRSKSYHHDNSVYQDFKKIFGDLPFITAQGQAVPITDSLRVNGSVEQRDYVEIFKSSKVMYYHSTEERHLHYHPVEAIVYGMPVIFRSGGVLEFLAKKKLPGCCDTPEDARSKVLRILNGDESFIREVLSSQKFLLREFDPSYVEDSWLRRFVPCLENHYQGSLNDRIEETPSHLKHIGVWMHQTNPTAFTGEGISRLLAMVVRGAQEHANVQMHIAAVSWVKQAIVNYMEDLGVDTRRLSFIFVDERPPLIIRLYQWWTERKPRERKPGGFWIAIRASLRRIASSVLDRLALTRSPLSLLAIAVALILVSPLLVVIGSLYVLGNMIKKLFASLGHILNRLTSPHEGSLPTGTSPQPAGGGQGGVNYPGRFFSRRFLPRLLTRQFFAELVSSVYNHIKNAEMASLAWKVGRDPKFTAWFFAYPNNKYLSYFTTPTIVAVPDIVYFDVPSKYSQLGENLIQENTFSIRKTINQADAIVTFSDYIRKKHVVELSGKPQEFVTVIPHAPIETRTLLSSRSGVDKEELWLIARRNIHNYLRKVTQGRRDKDALYLQSLNLGLLDYLFVSSQSRLHKNHLSLLKAYRILLRERYQNLKLIFTGAFPEEMDKYIKQERLHLDVLSMHYMPPVVHASFYACAKLTVVPTLFEGGFPFVFSESLSVHTPVVMSDIPVVREVLTDTERPMYCFDPYNVQEIADKISWALENRPSLLQAQTETYERLQHRTWKDVANEYLHVFLNTQKRKEQHDAAALESQVVE